jgi:hypothetical protein
MRKLLTFIFLMFAISTLAQVPQGFNYQAVIRNSSGDLIQDQNVSVRISILQGNATGSSAYTETHSEQTNTFGLIDLIIGQGQSSDNFTTVDWSNNPYYLKIELDVTGSTDYVEFGTSQLLSVPYAMYAGNAENSDDADADPTNELQVLSISNDTIYLAQGSFVKLPTASVPQQFSVSEFGDTLYLSNGNSIVIPGLSVNNYNYPKLGAFLDEFDNEEMPDFSITTDDNLIYGSSNENHDIIFNKMDTLGNKIWDKSYDIDTLNRGNCSNIIKTNDGGYLSTWSFEYSNPEPNYYSLQIKINSSGDTLWTRSNSSYIYQTSDNNYLSTTTKNEGMYTYAVLVKLEEAGDTLWTKQYDFLYNENGYIHSFLETSDGSYLFIGGGMSKMLIKTNTSGDTLWTRPLPSMYNYYLNETSDNKYLILDQRECNVIKLNPDKSVVWENEYKTDYSNGGDELEKSFCLDNGDIILIGETHSDGPPVTQSTKLGESDIWILYLNSSGDEINSKIYGGSLSDIYKNSFKLSNGRILIISGSESYNGYVPNETPLYTGMWIFTLDTN